MTLEPIRVSTRSDDPRDSVTENRVEPTPRTSLCHLIHPNDVTVIFVCVYIYIYYYVRTYVYLFISPRDTRVASPSSLTSCRDLETLDFHTALVKFVTLN